MVPTSFTTQQDAEIVKAFFVDKDTSAYIQPLEQVRLLFSIPFSRMIVLNMRLVQGLDTLRSRARWLERDTQDVAQWLRQKGYLV